MGFPRDFSEEGTGGLPRGARFRGMELRTDVLPEIDIPGEPGFLSVVPGSAGPGASPNRGPLRGPL